VSPTRHPRVVVSGTYSTGKTTTATALAHATGIPLVRAPSAREILTTLYPGRAFQHMSAEELLALGLRRLDERVRAETELGTSGFISDGSVLNEWAYAAVRARIGLNPGASIGQQAVKALLAAPSLPFLRRYVRAYGTMARCHALEGYDAVVHLPVEFPMDADGHRPVSERYRSLSDRDLHQQLVALGLPVHVVAGPIHERVEQVIGLLDLPVRTAVTDAVARADDEIARSREAVARRILAQQPDLTRGERARLVFRL
jgi:nicotinamide riboside kinase